MVLPAGSFAEGDGTVVNNEGRAQRYFQVYDPAYYDPTVSIRDAWVWLRDLRAQSLNQPIDWTHFDDVTAACAAELPPLANIVKAAPNSKFRMHGMKVAREPHRYSGRTAMRANLSVHEPRQPQDADTALAFSMEGHNGTQAGTRPSALIPYAWAPGWNSPQAWNKFQDEVGGHLQGGDPGVRLIDPPPMPRRTATSTSFRAAFNRERRRVAHGLPFCTHIFGSEELSARAAPVGERIPAAYVALNPADADRLRRRRQHALLDVSVAGQTVRLPLRLQCRRCRGAPSACRSACRDRRAFAAGAAVKLCRRQPRERLHTLKSSPRCWRCSRPL